RPQFLPKEVLWYYEDCATDKSYGDIITKNNKYRPKMNLTIRRPDGSKVSAQEFANIRHSTAIISFIKHLFKAEYDRAILELEAEQRLLRLCYAHWKADTMIGQVFVRRNEVDAKAASNRARATSSRPSDDTSEPPLAPVPQVWDIAPVNMAKRAFELSPGPKSPSASQAQKCSKDGVSLSGQKTTGPSVPSNCKYSIQRSFNTNSYLHTEPHPDNLIGESKFSVGMLPLTVLTAVLTSDFPSMTNALSLIRSMNAQMLFKQGKPSEKVTMLLERVQFADPGSPDIDEDNTCQSWGHDLFTAGGISPSSSLTTWEDVGSVATAFKLVAAALKICQEARLMCTNAGTPKTSGFISDIYLEKILECLENCWVGAGG
ncbi:hypothetical protein H4582DRAFT_1793231, partial [Lactarius indigo]